MFDDVDRPLEPDAPSEPESEPDAPSEPESEPDAPSKPECEPDAPSEPEGEPEPSPAQARFQACRWHADVDDQKYCSNRDVLPYAGKGGFDPEAWCPDCALYKLRRTPKKRPRIEDEPYP